MRKLSALGAVLLTACSTVTREGPVHGVTPGHVCNAADSGKFIGLEASDANGEAIKRATSAAVLRWARPGIMLTMDYREDRVTVRVGPDGKVTAVNCG